MFWGTLEITIFSRLISLEINVEFRIFFFSSILWCFVKMFAEFQNPAPIFKLPVALRVLKTSRACTRWGVREKFFFFFLMVSEQVNLIHDRCSYGKIEKKY